MTMPLKRHRASDPKTEILRSVFHDNLIIAGKRPDPVLSKLSARWHRKLRPLFFVAMIAVMWSFSQSVQTYSVAESPWMTPPAARDKTIEEEPEPVSERPAPGYADIEKLFELRFADKGPSLDDFISRTESLQDYQLLLSRKDHVRLTSLFGLQIKTIVIDPGHGGRDPGAIGAKGTKEKQITLDVAKCLKARLDAKGTYNVLLTRDTDKTLPLIRRVAFAKENKADIFISVHVNSLPDQMVNVIETYYFGPPLSTEGLQLAETENKESHFNIGELDAVIQDIGNTVKRQESAMLAGSIQKSLYQNVKNDGRILDVGIKTAPFVVLSQTGIPSVLVEISCLTKEEEEARLALPEYRDKVASYMEEGIVSYLETQYARIITGENKNE